MISTDQTTLLESGGSVVVGTVDAEGWPDATRSWLTRVAPGGTRLRCLLPDHSGRSIDNLAAGGLVAVNVTDVATLESLQVKGRSLGTGAPTADDLEASARYRERFFDNLEENDGTARHLLERMVPSGYVAVDVEVTDVFDQTPGPNAGGRL